MTVVKLSSLPVVAVFFGAFFIAAPTPAAADHCYHLVNGMIYCYDTLPDSVTHHSWNSDQAPPLPLGNVWECNYMSHPRTICVSFGPDDDRPVIPKYLTGATEQAEG